jgi:hypothetical protein
MAECYKCGNSFAEGYKPGRQDVCPNCNAAVHCCLNCRFYDETAHNKCSEPQSEWVSDKEKGNFCHFFQLREKALSKEYQKESEKARKKWESLWKDD